MQIIFLDIDGVLVNAVSLRSRSPHEHSNADPSCVAALNRIVAETGAGIVVSSSWRIGQELADMREVINLHFGVNGNVLGMTPRLTAKKISAGPRGQLEVSAERGDEIDCWLRSAHPWPVESFVILDDEDDMGALKSHLVQTNFTGGLTMQHADRAIEILATCARPEALSRERTGQQTISTFGCRKM